MNDSHFPLFISLRNKPILIVGAGTIASRRAQALTDFGADIQVVAPGGSEKMEILCQEGKVHWERRSFKAEDIKGKFIVICATNDSGINDSIATLCKAEHVPVNHAGDRSQCDFYFPGIAREGNIVVGVTASGKNHKFVKELTGQLQTWLKHVIE